MFFKNPAGALCEEERLAIGIMGPVGRGELEKRRPLREEDVFAWLKGILEQLCAAQAFPAAGLALAPLAPAAGMAADFPTRCFQEQRLMSISLDGAAGGVLGLIGGALRREYRLLEPVAVLELRLAPLLRHADATPAAENLPVYPSVTRDIALRVSTALKHATVLKTIWEMAPKELTALRLFDIYQSEEIGVGWKSMAYSLTYRAPDRTLTDEEVNVLHESVKAGLRGKLKVEIREG